MTVRGPGLAARSPGWREQGRREEELAFQGRTSQVGGGAVGRVPGLLPRGEALDLGGERAALWKRNPGAGLRGG